MDRDVEVLPAHVVVSIEIARRRVALLGTRHVEPDDSGIAPAHRALRDLDRTCRLAHGRHEGLHHDGTAGSGRALDADAEALEIGLDDLVQRETSLGRQLGRVANLGVCDAVGRQILRAFGGDAGDRVPFLQNADGVGERFQV